MFFFSILASRVGCKTQKLSGFVFSCALNVKAELPCLWASVHVYLQMGGSYTCVCLFLASCRQMVTCRRWPSSMSMSQTCTENVLRVCLLSPWALQCKYLSSSGFLTSASARLRRRRLRSNLFGRMETNKSDVMKVLLTERVGSLLYDIKLATDGDLCPLFKQGQI